MAKTQEELQALKQEYEELTDKLKQLSEEELREIVGGELPRIVPDERYVMSVNWQDQKLPTDTGDYKLGVDVKPSDNWASPEGK